ncbi:MAG: CoA transferase, partial [Deltaproteobacteria bacterium]|nr:CoA transferase [Deltaproteobacteria bacterium]
MKQAPENNSILGGYRVLDLADEKGLMCGMLLGDLGADVVKIEKPDGDDARNIGPFYHDEPHPEISRFYGPLGHDNEYVYKEVLGLSLEEISDLMAEGV